MPSVTTLAAIQDVKLAAERLGSITIPMMPSPMDFHTLSIELRKFARAADHLASLAIAEASVNSTIEFPSGATFFHDQLDNEEVFRSLSLAADEAEYRNSTPRSFITGRRIVERVL